MNTTFLLYDSIVRIVTGYGLDGRWIWGSIPGMGKRFVSTLQRQDRLWGPSSLQSSGYSGHFLRGVKPQAHEYLFHRYILLKFYKHLITLIIFRKSTNYRTPHYTVSCKLMLSPYSQIQVHTSVPCSETISIYVLPLK